MFMIVLKAEELDTYMYQAKMRTIYKTTIVAGNVFLSTLRIGLLIRWRITLYFKKILELLCKFCLFVFIGRLSIKNREIKIKIRQNMKI